MIPTLHTNLLQQAKKTPHPNFAKWILGNVVGETLDLGCGNKWYHPFITGKVTSVDICEKSEPDYLLDISTTLLPFSNEAFDVVLLFDVLEHIDKEKGAFVIKEAQRVTWGSILVLTPSIWNTNAKNTFNPDSFYYLNPDNLHKSLYKHSDFSVSKGWQRVNDIFIPEEYCFYRWDK